MSIFYGNFDKFAESLSVTNRQKNTASKRGRFEELKYFTFFNKIMAGKVLKCGRINSTTQENIENFAH